MVDIGCDQAFFLATIIKPKTETWVPICFPNLFYNVLPVITQMCSEVQIKKITEQNTFIIFSEHSLHFSEHCVNLLSTTDLCQKKTMLLHTFFLKTLSRSHKHVRRFVFSRHVAKIYLETISFLFFILFCYTRLKNKYWK